MNYKKLNSSVFLIIFFVLNTSYVLSQEYGLEFNGQKHLVDERTGLDLTPSSFVDVKNDLELSFDINLNLKKQENEFGYIFRIINNYNNNIDLLLKNLKTKSLILVIEDKENIIPLQGFFSPEKDWLNFKLKFLKAKNELHFFIENKVFLIKKVSYKKSESYKVFFGGNDYNEFINYDVPDMKIRDIKILKDAQLLYHFPLKQCGGDFSYDIKSNKKAIVKNPNWILCNHQQWKLNFSSKADGVQLVAANEKSSEFYFLNKTHLLTYNVIDKSLKKLPYKLGAVNITSDHRAFFNENDNTIYCYLVDIKNYSKLDLETGTWSNMELFKNVVHGQKFQHHNSVFNKEKNELYIFGGYGQYEYNNIINKINFNTAKWETKPSNSNIFKPRYLAGSAILNDSIYILGGYGNDTGSQFANPQSHFDLLSYSTTTNTFKEKFEINRYLHDMVVANKMWIESTSRNYYALIHDKEKFNGYLKILKGNLDKSHTEILGDSIPFKFYDIKSFASLFYLPTEKKLFSYNAFLNDDDKTEYHLYSIDFPLSPKTPHITKPYLFPYKLIIVGILSMLLVLIIGFRKKIKLILFNIKKPQNLEPKEVTNQSNFDTSSASKNKPNYTILFFGGFQVFNKNRKDITSKFSPVLKELFLVVWMYTYIKEKGVSSEKIEDILWEGKSNQKARNNRSVNITKLRTLLKEIGDIDLNKDTGYWKINYNQEVLKTDFSELIKISKNKKNSTRENIDCLLNITKNGSLLYNVNYEWLDSFKADISDTIIDTLIAYARKFKIKEDPDFILRLTDCIFNFDSINELAVIYRCRAQNYKGNHSLAKNTFEKFQREYELLYAQNFKYSLPEILQEEFNVNSIF